MPTRLILGLALVLATLSAPAHAQMAVSQPATSITPYHAHTVTPYHARTLQLYRAHRLHRLTTAERAAMLRRDRMGYHRGKRARGKFGATEAQINAYGALNHNVGVWSSGQDFTMRSGN